MSFQFFRRFFYEIHLWLGILCGIIVFVICLSGAVLVFRDEINRFVDPGKYYVSVPADKKRLSIDELITKVETKNQGMKVTSLTIPTKENRTVVVSLSNPLGGGERGGFGGRQRGEGRTRPEGERGNRTRGERGNRPERNFDRNIAGNNERGNRPEGNIDRNVAGNNERGNQPEGNIDRNVAGNNERGNRPERNFDGNVAGNNGRENRPERERNGTRQRDENNNPNNTQAGRGSQGGGRGGQGGGQGGGRGGQGGGRGGRGGGWYVNPYTGDIVANPTDGVSLNRFFMSMQQLHRNLWISYRIESLGPRSSLGGLIVGVATIIFVVMLLSGFVLWLPRTWKSFAKWRAWKPGLKIRVRKGIWSFLYDIHNTVGFYCLIPMLILAMTGLCWSFSWYRSGASYVLGEQVLNRQRQQNTTKIDPIDENTKPLSIDEMIQRLNALIPGNGEITLNIPNDKESPMTIQKGKSGFFALSVKDRTQWDRFRGTVIPIEHYGKKVEVERFTDKPIGTQIASSVRALHFGEITGLSSKIVFFTACFFAMTFPITGITLWIRKLAEYHKKRKTNKTKIEPPPDNTK
ncbi:MAG: PepSY domain-containing protein [Planctomycetaceae bacterium]|jgi:uncharacterized iron-regulated membrane protein|nr:PepSY domain-containing protein [Planctomycetaceae bacterium]